jgi:hypothetical protein
MKTTKTTKIIALIGATLAMSLMLADAASAFSVKVTKTVSDGFGDTFTKTKRFSDNGFEHCKSVSRRATDAFGDSSSRTVTRCGSDF